MSDVQAGAGAQWGKLPVLTAHFEQIDAEWKTHIYKLLQLSQPNPFYKDLPKIGVETPKLLQEYLLGKQDLDTFISKLEAVIDKADKNTL